MSYNSLFGLGVAADANLQGYWRQQETSGLTAIDDSGNSNDGSYVGYGAGLDGAELQTGPNDYFTSAVNYSNADRSANFGNPDNVDDIGAMTFGAWVKQINSRTGILAKTNGDSGSQSFRISANSTGAFSVYLTQSGSHRFAEVSTDNLLAGGAWHYVAFSWSGGNSLDFMTVDGVDVASTTPVNVGSVTTVLSTTQDLIIGKGILDTRGVGDVAGMSFFNRASTLAELVEGYNGPELKYVSGATFGSDGAFNVGTWAIPEIGGSNGTPSYVVRVVNAAGTEIDTFSTSTSGTFDLSSEAGNLCYLLVKADNTGGADVGDEATRTSGYGSPNDGYYEIASVTAAGGGGGLSIPIAMYHYTNHLGTMSR